MIFPQIFKAFRPGTRNSGLVAVAIDRRGASIAQVNLLGARPRVLKCAFHPLSEISAGALEKICREAQVEHENFTTLLSPGEYQLLMVDAPNVPVDELKTAIRWKIKDTLSYHVDDATVDVLQIPSIKYGSERAQSLYAIAAPNEVLRRRISLFEKARLALGVIDIPETAQRNIAALFEIEARALALLAFTDEGGLLTITCDGELFLARRMEITTGQLQDADDVLRQQFLDRVELELQRSLDYFDRQFQHIPVNRVLFSAPGCPGLETQLSSGLGMPVERLDLAQGMDLSAVPELADAEFANALLPVLGAALRQEKKAL